MAQDIADKFGLVILLLPVAHPGLNPIKLVWSIFKCNCATRNQDYKLSDVERIGREELKTINAQIFASLRRNAIKNEVRYIEAMKQEDSDE